MTTIRLKTDFAIKACNAWLVERKKWRAEMRETAIQKEMNRFFFKPKTRLQAEQRVDAPRDGFPPMHYWVGGIFDGEIETVLKAAEYADNHGDGFVTVDGHIAELLKEALV